MRVGSVRRFTCTARAGRCWPFNACGSTEQVDNVASGQDDDGMLVRPGLLVRLPGDVAGGDEDTELPVPETGDQAA